jgi:hypothetical protein
MIMLLIGIGGMLGGDARARRTAAMFHGIGLVILLVAGFGLIAKLKLPYTSPFIIAKAVIWLLLGGIPAFGKRMSVGAAMLIAVVLAGCAAYLGYLKALPF